MRETDIAFKAAVAILVVLGAAICYRMFNPSTTFAADGIDASWDAAAKYSHDASRPAVVVFTAQWCPTCRMLHGNVLSRGNIRAELQEHYSIHTVDLTDPSPQARELAHKFGATAIPLMIRYDSDGKETARCHYLNPVQMMAWLKAGE